jgi:predicted transcriptional regulator
MHVQLGGRRGNTPAFGKVLPGKMAELVREGLFEPHDGTYRITAKGRAKLAELEKTHD